MLRSKLILRQHCLKNREIYFKKNGNDCLKSKDINVILSEVLSKFKISSIGIYYPTKSEISPLKLIEISKKLSINICLPVINNNTNDLIFSKFKCKHSLKKNKFGIIEPTKLNKTIPEIIFVPMVGFDKKLNRLGYGKGYYDRTISKLRKSKKIFVIGLAYDNQFIMNIPTESHDEKMDIILTDKKIYR
ncbi:5-formyltetrahydrofolate cyclo-ligase [Alphaproteobacteria bacterium]|nr:5-formyltetrahydrofolate cyclo-ligase [Alphaproteobacteria bacterium]